MEAKVKKLERRQQRDAVIKIQNKEKIASLTTRVDQLQHRLQNVGKAASPPARKYNNSIAVAKMQAFQSLIEEGEHVGRYEKKSMWWKRTQIFLRAKRGAK